MVYFIQVYHNFFWGKNVMLLICGRIMKDFLEISQISLQTEEMYGILITINRILNRIF